jgi:TPR repeat protein
MRLQVVARRGVFVVVISVFTFWLGGAPLEAQEQHAPGAAYTVRVVPCGEFGKPTCGTLVTIPAGATGASLYKLAAAAQNAGREWEALIYVQKAAEMGYLPAEAGLAEDFRLGREVPVDLVKARYWMQKAADQGNAPAQRLVGEMYELGQGGAPDMATAVHYWELAAAQHGPVSEMYMGLVFEVGLGGVVHSRAKAISMMRRSAADGVHDAADYVNALSRAGTRRFGSIAELKNYVYPPRQPQNKQAQSRVPSGCPDELNFTGPMNMGPISRFCIAHPRCPYQRAGIENVCPSLSPGFGVN